MGVVTSAETWFCGLGCVAVSAYMGVVTDERIADDTFDGVAVSAYMGVVTLMACMLWEDTLLQSPPTWEL